MAMMYKISNFLCATILVTLIVNTIARPGQFEEFSRDKCRGDNPDLEVVQTCQKCAKQTKSPIVYPMCCRKEDDAYNWCKSFMNYGKIA